MQRVASRNLPANLLPLEATVKSINISNGPNRSITVQQNGKRLNANVPSD